MIIQPPKVTIDPPALTVEPPAITITPPPFTVTPPFMTVSPPPVTFNGKTYNPPSVTVTPPSITVTPPPIRIVPPAITVDPPALTVQPPPLTVEPPVGEDYVVVDPPSVTVDPPPITVNPPSITIIPPAMTVTPPSFTVPASKFTVDPPAFTIDPPGPLPPRKVDPPSFEVKVPAFSVTPPAFTVTPPPLTVEVPALSVDPPPITVDPPPVVVNLGDFSWGSPRYTTLVNNGRPDNRLDVAIIGDGYAASQQEIFRGHVQQLIDAFQTTEPMQTYFRHFNFHRVDVISPEDGTDDMYAHPPRIRRTALHTFYSPIAERRLVGPDPWVKEVVNQSGVPWDEIIVLINSPRRGGATAPTMEVAYASANSHDYPRIAIHEAGHSIAKLMDEYEDPFPDIDWPENWVLPSVLPWINVDTDPQHPKWQPWLTPGVELPTADEASENTVGAFKGAAYTPSGVYRPMRQCMMRDHDFPFCVVCSEGWIGAIYRRSRLADAFYPKENLKVTANRLVTFSAKVVRPDGVRSTWFIKTLGWQQKQHTESYQDFTLAFPRRGRFQVKVVLEDNSIQADNTGRIRSQEVLRLARQEYIWNISVL